MIRKANEPYRPPAIVDGDSSRRGNSPFLPLPLASILWAALSIKVVAASYLLVPVFEEFGLELPTLTRALLHPMAPLVCLVITCIVILGCFAIESPGTRKRFGRIALALGLVAFAVSLLGFALPLLSLIHGLSATASMIEIIDKID